MNILISPLLGVLERSAVYASAVVMPKLHDIKSSSIKPLACMSVSNSDPPALNARRFSHRGLCSGGAQWRARDHLLYSRWLVMLLTAAALCLTSASYTSDYVNGFVDTPTFIWGKTDYRFLGMMCLPIIEPGTAFWDTYFLCSPGGAYVSNWIWSYKGRLPSSTTDGKLDCVRWYNPSETYWDDNWLCMPHGQVTYTFSYTGPVPGMTCTRITGPSSNNWSNTYFCAGIDVVSNAAVHMAPTALTSSVTYNNLAYTFYVGNYFTSYVTSDSTMGYTYLVPFAQTERGVASVVFNNKIYLFYSGWEDANNTWYKTYDGTSWSAERLGRLTPYSLISPVVWNGGIYMFYRTSDGSLRYDIFDGADGWIPGSNYNTPMSGNPSCAVQGVQKMVSCFFSSNTEAGYTFNRATLGPLGWIGSTVLRAENLLVGGDTRVAVSEDASSFAVAQSVHHNTAEHYCDIYVFQASSSVDSFNRLRWAVTSSTPASMAYLGATLHLFYPNPTPIALAYTSSSVPNLPDPSPPTFYTAKPFAGRYMVITADPQYAWCDDGAPSDPTCVQHTADADKEPYSRNLIASQYTAVNRVIECLGALSVPVDGMIVNGDITAGGAEHQVAFMKEQVNSVKTAVYLGLGNHDYDNPVNDHDGYLGSCEAARSIDYVVDHVKAMPGVGYMDWQGRTGSAYYGWPVGGRYLFMQLHNHPFYTRDFFCRPSVLDEPRRYKIESSYSKLIDDLLSAREVGFKVFLNMHDYGDTRNDTHHWDPALLKQFSEDMAAFSDVVCAMFVGHFHDRWGTYEKMGSIPVFYSGSAPFQTFTMLHINDVDHTFTVTGFSNNNAGTLSRVSASNTFTNRAYSGGGTYSC